MFKYFFDFLSYLKYVLNSYKLTQWGEQVCVSVDLQLCLTGQMMAPGCYFME